MRYLLRELYYWLVGCVKRIQYKNLKLGFRAKISKGAKFEGYNKIEHHSYFSGEIGFASYIGEYSNFTGKIGKYCSIGGDVKVISLTHPVKKFVSTAPCFYSVKKTNGFTYVNTQKFTEELYLKDEEYPVVVGNDVYIGYGVTIIAPVKIGDGAVIAANSVVTKDVEPYAIVGGNPAKEIRKRFEQYEIQELKSICWWDRGEKWIRDSSDYFDDIQRFIQYAKDEGI